MDRLSASDADLLESVKLGEGLRLIAYPDPLTRASPWTIGYGHTGPDVGPTTRCSADKAESWLKCDLSDAMTALDQKEPWWRDLPLEAQRVVAEMTFNMGLGHLQGFHRFLVALKAQNWTVAASEMMHSLWASQVGERATRLSKRLAALSPITEAKANVV